MATARINFEKTSKIGAPLYSALRHLIEGRKGLGEVARMVGRYNDANDDVATDSGIASGDVQAFKDLLARASAELTGTALVQVNQNDLANIRAFVDSLTIG